MSKLIRLAIVVIILFASMPAIPALAAQPVPNCTDGTQASGAVYRICMPKPPTPWNGSLVVYAHGYVPNLGQPPAIPEDQLRLPDGTYLPDLVNSLGFAFAMSSYSANGLAVIQGIADTRDVVNIFKAAHSTPRHIYLVGASEGGLITTLAIEKHPGDFSGGLAVCGPVGDFRGQINYWGDFRVVFDYFFPGALPRWTETNITIPPAVMANWTPTLTLQIANAIVANPSATQQLLQVTNAPTDPANGATITETVLGLLWYNVFATNDGLTKLGGNPFDNKLRWYSGSENDWRLNRSVARFKANSTALTNIANNYQTSGRLTKPLVTLHTTGDPIVPYWHEPLYRLKVLSKGSALMYSNIPILRYGHCNFEPEEVLVGFALLVLKVTGQELIGAQKALPNTDAQTRFERLAKEHGALK